MTSTLPGSVPIEEMGQPGHAGLFPHPSEVDYRQARGLPVYRPTDPKLIDQAPYRRFAAERGPNSK